MSTYTFDNDPFADPTITAATNQNNTTVSGLEDYNPFANQPTQNVDPFSPTSVVPTAPSTPATAVLTSNNIQQNFPPSYNQSINNTLTAEQLRQRQEELDRKAAELSAREAELQRAQQMGIRQNNFPPLPSFFPCKPCFYQDFNVEIEVGFQKIVQQVYQLWIFYIVTLLVNFIACLVALIEGVGSAGGMFSFSLVTLILFTPLSYICWFRPLYKAFRDDSSFNFMVFFFVFFCQLVMSSVWALGLPNSSSIGLIITIKMINNKSEYSILFILICILCTIVLIGYAIASLFILIKVHGIYHKSSASIQKAQAEFTSKVLNNERVQQMASSAAQTAARQAMNQTFSPTNQQPTGGFRY